MAILLVAVYNSKMQSYVKLSAWFYIGLGVVIYQMRPARCNVGLSIGQH